MHVWNIKLIDSFVRVYMKNVNRQYCLLKRGQITKCLFKEKGHIHTPFSNLKTGQCWILFQNTLKTFSLNEAINIYTAIFSHNRQFSQETGIDFTWISCYWHPALCKLMVFLYKYIKHIHENFKKLYIYHDLMMF